MQCNVFVICTGGFRTLTMLGAETGRAVKVPAGTQGQYDALDIGCVLTQTGQRFAARVVVEGIVDGRQILRGGVGDIAAEVEKVVAAVCRIPIQFLPGVCGIVEGTADGPGNGHGKVAVIGDSVETEEGLEVADRTGVVGLDEKVKGVDDGVEVADAVGRTELLYRGVPLRVGEDGMNDGARGDAAEEDIGIGYKGEGRLGSGEAAAVEYPCSVW